MKRPPLRADAARNRAALLATGRKCFARAGAAAQMDDIAEAAGLGIGTLYRHFPSKTDLIVALLDERLHQLLCLAHEPAAASAFARFSRVVSELVELQSRDRLISDLGFCRDEDQRRATEPMLAKLREAVAQLMAEAVATGDLRADVGVDDVLRIVFNDTLSSGRNVWQTYARVVLDGLRAAPAGKAPVPRVAAKKSGGRHR